MPSLSVRRAADPPPRSALSTPLCDLLGIRHALLLAGMAGGPNTPELVSEVSRAGALGVLGVTGMTVDAVARATQAALARAGGGPVGVNVQLAPRSPATGERERIAAVLAPFRAELGLDPEPAAAPPPTPAGAARDRRRGGRFGDHDVRGPHARDRRARRAGIPLLAMVTTPEEAVRAVARGRAA